MCAWHLHWLDMKLHTWDLQIEITNTPNTRDGSGFLTASDALADTPFTRRLHAERTSCEHRCNTSHTLRGINTRRHLLSTAFIWSKKYSQIINITTTQNSRFLFRYIYKCHLLLWCKAEFDFTAQKKIPDYHQCWTQLCCFIFLWKS